MKIMTSLILLFISLSAVSAESAENMNCNLLGRESALRISEETQLDLNREQRQNVASIVEQACIEYSDAGLMASVNTSETAVMSSNAQQEEVMAEENVPAEEEKSGLFSLKVIDPEGRVQRPGLKRR